VIIIGTAGVALVAILVISVIWFHHQK